MGIRNLNKYLLENCSSKSIQKVHLSCLSGKYIAIDTSIYLYKFASEGTLIESMYLFISILKNYQIVPIFVFDGKPPDEKRELLRSRKHMKIEAEEKYNELNKKDVLTTKDLKELDTLKRQFVNVTENDIRNVKHLMDIYGVTYHTSPGEADQLCCHFVKTKQVWGCLSDDMDMFIYGCERVFRGISLLNHTVILYKTNSILRELSVPFSLFQCMLILCGTDYNILSHENNKIPIVFSYYNKYLSQKKQSVTQEKQNNYEQFYHWLTQQENCVITLPNLNDIYKLQKLFMMDTYKELNTYNVSKENLGIYNLQKLVEFLQKYNFVFL